MLFFAWYPTVRHTKDGMIQRIAAVDSLFEHIPRTYIAFSLWSNFRKQVTNPAERVTYIELNVFLHCRTIVKAIRKASVIYAHSVFNCLALFLYRALIGKLSNKNLVLDLHGIVPEELQFNGQQNAYLLYRRVERWVFKTFQKVVAVTTAMQAYMSAKYPDYTGRYLVFNIYPTILETDRNQQAFAGIDTRKTVVVYSGNLSKWQNIDLMLETIKQNLSDRLSYVILTGDKPGFEKELAAHELKDKVVLLSLSPAELPAVYQIADYGFILRTDMPINNVANPTKLIEYLHFGMIPVVLSEKIGDFYRMGYEYVPVDRFSDRLPKAKSDRNRQIAAQIKAQNEQADLYTFVRSR